MKIIFFKRKNSLFTPQLKTSATIAKRQAKAKKSICKISPFE